MIDKMYEQVKTFSEANYKLVKTLAHRYGSDLFTYNKKAYDRALRVSETDFPQYGRAQAAALLLMLIPAVLRNLYVAELVIVIVLVIVFKLQHDKEKCVRECRNAILGKVINYPITQDMWDLFYFDSKYINTLTVVRNVQSLDMLRRSNDKSYVLKRVTAKYMMQAIDERVSAREKDIEKLYSSYDYRVARAAEQIDWEYKPSVMVVTRYSSPQGRHQSQTEVVFTYEEIFDLSNSDENIEVNKFGVNKKSIRDERAKLTPKIRYQALKKYNYTCQYCGRTASDGVKLHVDHIIPVSRGGKTEMDNLTVACEECNIGKGSDI